MPAKNIEAARKSRRKWYASNKKKAKRAVYDRRLDIKEWFNEFRKELQCSFCSEDEICCLDFHHHDPSKKEKAVGQMVNDGWGKKRILEEIAKCQVVCSNCHRKIHASII